MIAWRSTQKQQQQQHHTLSVCVGTAAAAKPALQSGQFEQASMYTAPTASLS
jgi:hypothetical protein